jgi:acetate---CoA ligase (ADP-forming)
MTTAPEFDLVVAVIGSSARFHPDLAVQPVIDSAGSPTPLAVFATPEAPEALARLAASGVPAFRTPESCADAIAAALRRRPPPDWREPSPIRDGELSFLDEAAAYGRLAARQIEIAPFAVATGGADLLGGVSFPVAVKALSAELPHKTDVGGVVLAVRDAGELAHAMNTVRANVARARPDLVLDRMLVQSMVDGVGEVLIGFRRDGDVGPIVVLAAGGVLAELGGEPSLRLAPVTLAQAEAMIAELPALRALAGYRGRTKGDLNAVAQALVALSSFASEPDVIEVEINPLIVREAGRGAAAVDALMRVVKETIP